jgi:very-short-patch-repair endonuclease
VVARVDFLWRGMSTIGEADGRLKYTIGAAIYREKRREDRLRDLGLEVVRWDFADVRHSPQATADRIRAAFRRAQRRLLAS